MTFELKHIDIWSVMKIGFLTCCILGFIVGLFYAIVLILVGGILDMVGGGEFEEISGFFSSVFGLFMAFVLAIFYAVTGSLMAAILAWLYNIFARFVGGVTLSLESGSGLGIGRFKDDLSAHQPTTPPQSSSL